MIIMAEHTRALRRGAGYALLGTALVQLSAAAVLVAVDAVRKRRHPPSGYFPRIAPEVVHAHESALSVYTDGDELYDAMLRDIRGARDSIFFETYIWKGDEVGERFKTELTTAARRGVDVYVIYDTFANLVVPRSFKTFDPALQVLEF